MVNADEPEPFPLQEPGDAGKQPIVAAGEQGGERRQALHCAEIETQFREFGPPDAPDCGDLDNVARRQGVEEFADLAKAQPEMGKSFDALVGRAGEPDEERRSAGLKRGFRQGDRKIAAAANDRQRPLGRELRGLRGAGHTASSLPGRGMQTARSPPSRRKSRICMASGWPANSAMRLSTRSFSVPSAAKSNRYSRCNSLIASRPKPRRRRPTTLSPARAARLPSAMPKGMTSFSTPARPPMKACAPIRANWWTAAPPPRMAESPIRQWPASITLLDRMTSSPSLQSCATCELARNTPRAPTIVSEPPPAVPGFIVTPSRIRQSGPMIRRTGSPRYLRSCGGWPIEAKG